MVLFLRGWLRSIGRTAVTAGLLVLVVCLSLVSIEIWRMVDARRMQIEEATVSATNLAKSVSEMSTGTFAQVDVALTDIVERLEVDGTKEANLARLDRLLHGTRVALPQLQRFSVFDASGRRIAADASGLDPSQDHSDREYFRHHRLSDDRAPHVGPPIQLLTTKQWTVTLSRRFNDPQGHFAGVVVASIGVDFFGTYFEQFDLGTRGTILLVSSAGVVVTRRPFRKSVVGTNIADGPLFRDHIAYDDHGTAWIRSRFDDIDRLTAFRKAEGLPMYAIVSLARDDILAPWVEDSVVHGGASLAFLFLIAAVGWALVRHSVRRHRDQLSLLASSAAMAQSHAQLEGLVREDGLTGIANRREFDRVLREQVDLAIRQCSSLALLVIDIDHFKTYNDTLGHFEGDRCLKRVAEIVRASVTRPGDLAARYGGEEFVVLMPNTDNEGARGVAENLRSALSAAAIPHPGGARGVVTVSIGLAAIRPDRSGFTSQALIEIADRALYSAKKAGRDRVHVHEGNAAAGPRPTSDEGGSVAVGTELASVE